MATRHIALVLAAAMAAAAVRAQAQSPLPVFSGDPIDLATGQPRSILPGLPLMLPGRDELYGTADDVIDTGVVGDVDVVIRAGGIFTGATIPPPAADVDAARRAVPGPAGAGTAVAFQVVLSDGAPLPAAGNPLTGSQHDGRGALVVAYPDLDGDGILGPTNADGSADNEIELQETLSVAGRQVAVIQNGVASGSLGVSLGAPASAGGLGLVLVGGALIGQTAASHFFDGPWISTLLPFMPPIDPTRIIGRGNVRPPDPQNTVEVDLEGERFGHLPPDHPVLGSPFAIPLDGSSPTVDLARSEAGLATAAKLGRPIDPATFTADPLRRVLPAVDQQGRRLLVEPVQALSMMDDGPGSTVSLVLFPADLLGNPTDPGAAMVATLEVGPALVIVSPDADGDLHREAIVLSTAAAAPIILDDAGVAGDGGATERVVVLVDGLPSDSIRATFVPGQGGQTFTLQVNMAGTGSGAVTTTQGGVACGPGCSQWPAAAQVTLTAVADVGSQFVGWSGCGVSANPAVLTMSANRTCTATFVPDQGGQTFTLQVNMAGTGSGAVTTTQGGVACGLGCSLWPAAAQVTLTAVADVDSQFVGWSGCGVSANPAVLTMSANRSCTATFDLLSAQDPEALSMRRTVLYMGRNAAKGWVVVDATFTADPAAFDPTAVPVTLTVRDGPGVVFYSRTLPAGAFTSKNLRAVFGDPIGTLARVARFAFARPHPRQVPDAYRVHVNVRRVDLTGIDPGTAGSVVVELTVGDARYAATVGCVLNSGRTTLTCRP